MRSVYVVGVQFADLFVEKLVQQLPDNKGGVMLMHDYPYFLCFMPVYSYNIGC